MTIKKTFAAAALTLMAGWTPLHAQEASDPIAVVVHFLGLRPDQLPVLQQALHERQQTLAPILQGIAQREQQIRALIASGGDPAEIGVLVVQIHHLRQQAEAAQAVFLAHVEALLDAGQRVRWQQVRMAARLLPVVPAFQALQML